MSEYRGMHKEGFHNEIIWGKSFLVGFEQMGEWIERHSCNSREQEKEGFELRVWQGMKVGGVTRWVWALSVGLVMADDEVECSEGDCEKPSFVGKLRMNFILMAMKDY